VVDDSSDFSERLNDSAKVDVYPDLISAYLINMGKALILVGGIVGMYFLAIRLLATNPFIDALNTIGVDPVWGMRGAFAAIGIYFFLVLMDTLSLTSYGLVFADNNLTFSYGNIFKVRKTVPFSAVLRVNFNAYSPFKFGDVLVELTGTEIKQVKVRYVANAAAVCQQINQMIRQTVSQKISEV